MSVYGSNYCALAIPCGIPDSNVQHVFILSSYKRHSPSWTKPSDKEYVRMELSQ